MSWGDQGEPFELAAPGVEGRGPCGQCLQLAMDWLSLWLEAPPRSRTTWRPSQTPSGIGLAQRSPCSSTCASGGGPTLIGVSFSSQTFQPSL